MAPTESDFDWIEAYLAGELTPESRARLEARLREDEAFAAAFALQKDTQRLVQVAAGLNYKAELQRIDAEMAQLQQQPFFRHLVFRVAAMIVFLFACVYALIFFQYNNQRIFGQAFSPYPDKFMYRGETPTADSLMKAGMEVYNQQQYAAAIPIFSQLVQADPNQPGAWLYLGISQLSTDDAPAALSSLEQAANSPAWEETANWYRALALLQDGQSKAAQTVLQQIANQETNAYREQAVEVLASLGAFWRNVPGVSR